MVPYSMGRDIPLKEGVKGYLNEFSGNLFRISMNAVFLHRISDPPAFELNKAFLERIVWKILIKPTNYEIRSLNGKI